MQLNEVYSKADRLKKWFKKIRIDSFSQGSVLVDYFVELDDVSRDINTQEIKQMFHNALTEVPMTVVPLKNNATTSSNMERIMADFPDNAKPSRSNYLMGDFILDPLATDFIGEKFRSKSSHDLPLENRRQFIKMIIFLQLFQNHVHHQHSPVKSNQIH